VTALVDSTNLGGEYEVDEVVHGALDGAELGGCGAGVHHDLRLPPRVHHQSQGPTRITKTAAT